MITLIQFASPENKQLTYTRKAWDKTEGYAYPCKEYLEIPTWAAITAGKLKAYGCVFKVLKEPVLLREVHHVFGSVLDANLNQWVKLIRLNQHVRFFLGGYVEKSKLTSFTNVYWLDSPEKIKDYFFNVDEDALPDYTLFAGQTCIPRLALSYGCLYKCSFCTISRKLILRDNDAILAEVESFKPLSFKLIYIDDKTFSQAKNWTLLDVIYRRVKAYNPDFQGFIVQTTALEVIKNIHEFALDYHVKYVEIGVETLNQQTLTTWRKPHGVKHILRATELIRALYPKIKLIPNIIFGIPPDDRGPHSYVGTLQYLRANLDIIAFINPYVLCAYHDSKGNLIANSDGDADENSLDKTWLTGQEQERIAKIIDCTLGLV